MNNYETMYKTLCRLCLSQNSDDKMVNLIDNSSDDGLSCFGKAVLITTNVLIRKDDKLPNMMCEKCIYLLKQTIFFKLKCETTDKQLKQLVNKNVNNVNSDRNISEIVCEYVIYNQYFPPKYNSEPSRRNSEHKRPLRTNNFIHKGDQTTSIEKVDPDEDIAAKSYDFDDFLDNDDIKSNFNDEQEQYSNEINSILDSIQNFINGDMNNTNTQRSRRKIKREQRYKPISRNERNLLCKICHKILANRFTYDHHMQRHNNCKFICDQCGKGFPVLSELHMHQIARHGVGPYLQCDHCPYKAPRKLNLIEHLRLHTGERPFTCEKCGLTFRRRAIWRNHLVCHMEKQYQCTYCPRKFYRHTSMLAHCNNIHERMYMYMCSICSVTYAKTETVRRHMVVKHGVPREKQGKITRVMNGSIEFPGKVV